MQDKEQQYNELLAPLVEEIHELARELQLPLLLAVQVSDDAICGSNWIPAEAAEAMHIARAIVQGDVQAVMAPVTVQPIGTSQIQNCLTQMNGFLASMVRIVG